MEKPNTLLKVLSIGKEKRANKIPMFVEREIKAFDKGNIPLEVKGVGLKGKGIIGYIKSYFQLRKSIRKEQPDVIHAHYSFSGVIAILASQKKNVVVTFLGSDVFAKTLLVKIAKWLVIKKAVQIIVVSDRIRSTFPKQNNVTTIPQGIDIDLFKPIDKKSSATSLGWDTSKINILFPSSYKRFEKNYDLAKEAIEVLKLEFDIDFHSLENVDPNKIPTYLNAADIVLLTSKWEGSSNVIKESMACNTIVISTNVGDAKQLFEDSKGYFISDHTVESVVSKIQIAIRFIKEGKTPNGRKRIIDLTLDEKSIAYEIFNVYKKVNY